jgi:hypothetical protein
VRATEFDMLYLTQFVYGELLLRVRPNPESIISAVVEVPTIASAADPIGRPIGRGYADARSDDVGFH